MKPSLGRIVLMQVDPTWNNGADVAPAVITRVWNDRLVNLRVLCDSENTLWKTSVTLFDTPEEAAASPLTGHLCYWPPRVAS